VRSPGATEVASAEKWLQYLQPRTPIVLAQLINNAGIVGAADAAA